MPVDEKIFDKEVENVVKKPKRKLTEKQLDNLRIGREKMKLKRELQKKNKELVANGKEPVKLELTKKELAKDKAASKEHMKEKKEGHKAKRKTLKQSNAEKAQAILEKLAKKEEEETLKKSARSETFSNLKVKCLEKAKSVKEYKEIQAALDGIDEDTLHNDDKLMSYAKNVMAPFLKKEKKNVKMEVIEETDEEKE